MNVLPKVSIVFALLSTLWFSCASGRNAKNATKLASKQLYSYHNLHSTPNNIAYGFTMQRYQFHSGKLLKATGRERLQLGHDKDVQYVLFAQYQRNFVAISPGKERLYIIGRRRLEVEHTFGLQQEFYDLLLLLEHVEPKLGSSRHRTAQPSWLSFYLDNNSQYSNAKSSEQGTVKNFLLLVADFSGDGLDDLFFGFESNRAPMQYFLYCFNGTQLQAIVRPWHSFTEQERQGGSHRYYSPFMREIRADIYSAFVAEIELDINYTINIDLLPMADELIRDRVYDRQGIVLQKRGIPHLDSNPILLPVRRSLKASLKSSLAAKLGQYMLRSVQQVRNRYGQLGVFICDWIFYSEGATGSAANKTIGRWVPDEASMRFLQTPRL